VDERLLGDEGPHADHEHRHERGRDENHRADDGEESERRGRGAAGGHLAGTIVTS